MLPHTYADYSRQSALAAEVEVFWVERLLDVEERLKDRDAAPGARGETLAHLFEFREAVRRERVPKGLFGFKGDHAPEVFFVAYRVEFNHDVPHLCEIGALDDVVGERLAKCVHCFAV